MTRASLSFIRGSLLAALACAASMSCGGGNPAPDSSNGSSSQDGSTISGTERIGWSQRAGSSAEANGLSYRVYVDGAAAPLTSVSCVDESPGTFGCSAPLPSLSAGRHTLELSSNSSQGESSRSEPLVVTVMRSLTSGIAAPASTSEGPPPVADDSGADAGSIACSTDGRSCFDVAAVAEFSDARRLIGIPDGRLFLISGDDRISAVERDGGIVPISVDAACRQPYRSHLSDLAASADFERDRLVYAAWACEARGLPSQLLLASYRELGDSLGEAEVVEAMAIADPNVDLAAGPGPRLHVAARTRSSWGLFAVAIAEGRIGQGRPRLMTTLPAAAAVAGTSDSLFVLTNGALLRSQQSTATGRSAGLQRVFNAGASGFFATHVAPVPSPSASGTSCGAAWLADRATLARVAIDSGASRANSGPAMDSVDVRALGRIAAIAVNADGDLSALLAPPADEQAPSSRRTLVRIVPRGPVATSCH